MAEVEFGDPRLPPRFWSKVRQDESGCWAWMASTTKEGYGRFSVDGIARMAHRVSYAALRGPLPPPSNMPTSTGLSLDHLCRVKRCVNPSHLEIVTLRVNTARAVPSVAARLMTGRCQRGHNSWVLKPEIGPQSHGCSTCHKMNAKERRALLTQAARASGMSMNKFRRTYGTSLAVIAEALEADQIGG